MSQYWQDELCSVHNANIRKGERVYSTSNNGGFKALHLNYIKLFYKGTQKQGIPALERYWF
jgi:hypothetical protein